jgi:hypothetical protein
MRFLLDNLDNDDMEQTPSQTDRPHVGGSKHDARNGRARPLTRARQRGRRRHR